MVAVTRPINAGHVCSASICTVRLWPAALRLLLYTERLSLVVTLCRLAGWQAQKHQTTCLGQFPAGAAIASANPCVNVCRVRRVQVRRMRCSRWPTPLPASRLV